MPPFAASCLCALVILWLFTRDVKQRGRVSSALWIPLTWAFIITTRPISIWLGIRSESAEGDNFVDKALFLFLIGAALRVLMKRGMKWRTTAQHNKWMFVYFLYLCLSILWSDEPLTSFKRWIKDFGNLPMVLVVLTETDPEEAVRAFFIRFLSLVIPISVLLIKYFPDLSRRYDMWTNQPMFVGLASDKNSFGMALFVCGLSLAWMLTRKGAPGVRSHDGGALAVYSILTAILVWLLVKAHSATAISCTVFGIAILLATRLEAVRVQVKRAGTYIAGLAAIFVLLHATGLWQMFVAQFAEMVGRDPKLHGRAEIWQAVLKEPINPLIGTGFYSFWSPTRNDHISNDLGLYYSLGEAHNGYIETYLNSGLVGITLLIAMIMSGLNRIKRAILAGSGFASLRLTFLITILVYNVTESAFDRLSILHMTLLLMLVEYPQQVAANSGARHSRWGGAAAPLFARTSPTASSAHLRLRWGSGGPTRLRGRCFVDSNRFAELHDYLASLSLFPGCLASVGDSTFSLSISSRICAFNVWKAIKITVFLIVRRSHLALSRAIRRFCFGGSKFRSHTRFKGIGWPLLPCSRKLLCWLTLISDRRER